MYLMPKKARGGRQSHESQMSPESVELNVRTVLSHDMVLGSLEEQQTCS